MKSMFSVFQKGLKKTATAISRSVTGIFSDVKTWDEESYEDMEASLIAADFGVGVSTRIVEDIRERYSLGRIGTSEDIVEVVKNDIKSVLDKNYRDLNLKKGELTVILMVGVNGSGKTTTSGKLAHQWKNDGYNVMMAACDTFRAAAVEQLNHWGERVGVHVVSAKHGADPSAVAFDAVQSAKARGVDILLIDTAGRQHTKKGLMDELAKMKRSINKVYPGAPQEVWLTVDASIGGNAIVQARAFLETAGINGLILTKLDGTGKGGMVVAIQNEFDIPVLFIGLGEQPNDLQLFESDFYVDALFRD